MCYLNSKYGTVLNKRFYNKDKAMQYFDIITKYI